MSRPRFLVHNLPIASWGLPYLSEKGMVMSRSYQKTPVCGHTTARSEKRDKQASHRRFRAVVRTILTSAPPEEDIPIPSEKKQYPGSRHFAKDGKQWLSGEFLQAGVENHIRKAPRVCRGRVLK